MVTRDVIIDASESLQFFALKSISPINCETNAMLCIRFQQATGKACWISTSKQYGILFP